MTYSTLRWIKKNALLTMMLALLLTPISAPVFNLPLVSGTQPYDWPMPGCDPPCTSFSPSTAPNTNATAWITPLPGGTVWAYPVVAEGKVFIGAGGYLNAFDENTGSPVWCFSAPAQPGYPCETVVGNRTVFFGTKEPGPTGCIYALDTTTGTQLWKFATEGYLQANPSIVGDRLYFGGYLGNDQGKIYCINATTGASLWNFTTQDRPTTIAVAYENVYVSCGHWETSTTAAIYCLDMYNGNKVWSKGTDRDCASSLSVANGKVYCAVSDETTNQIFYALNATNGNEVWSTTRYSNSGGGRTAVAYGKVFFAAGSYSVARGVYAMDETNGNQIWAFPTSTPPAGGPEVADGKVFFAEGTPSHTVYALNQTDGSLIWKYRLQGAVHSQTSAIANGRIFVADHYDPKLYAFGPQYNGAQSSLTITTTTGGTTIPSPGTYSYTNGILVSVKAIPSTDYILNHWELDGSNVGSQNPIIITVNEDHTLHGVFTYNTTVRAHCNTENTDISVAILMDGLPTSYSTPHTFANLTGTHNFTVPDTDLNGHLFKQWNTGETSTTITVPPDGTYTAYYSTRYNLTISTTAGGTTNPAPGNYSHWDETEVSVTATPSLGYILDHWKLDDVNVGSANPISVTMDKNHTLHAVFLWVGTCDLTIAVTSGGTTSPSPGTHSYTSGTSVSVTAIPYQSYQFVYWQLDGVNEGPINPILITMHSAHTLHAVFQYIQPGGCPFLYVYDGEEYKNEGLLDIHIQKGLDVKTNHTLNTLPKRVNNTYLFQLVEFPRTISHIDQVTLLAVLQNGTIVQLSPISAWHSHLGNMLSQLLYNDEWKISLLGARWNNGLSDSIQLTFQALPPDVNITAFTFQIEGYSVCQEPA